MERELKGLYVITVTPFQENGAVDEESLRQLTDFYVKLGVHGMTILGIMGEAHKLTERERLRVMDVMMEQNNNRVPIVVGCSANSTDVAVYLCRKAEEAHAAAVMIAPPQNLKNEALLLKHFAMIAERISIPIVLQDEPVTTNVILSPDFIAKLGEEIANIKYVKLEEAPTTIKISKILAKTAKLKIFGGLGGMYFYEELQRGASGIMTGFAFPELLANTYELFTANKRDEARAYFYRYLPLIRFEAQLGMGGVAIRKETYKLRKAINSAHVRFPSMPIDVKTMEELQDLIAYLGLKL